MLRGNYPATVDEKGRLKIPSAFLDTLKKSGKRFFVTSENGESARVYPMKFWEGIEQKLAKISTHNRAKQRFLDRANYLRPGRRNGRPGTHSDSGRVARVGADEGRCGRAGETELPGRLESHALRREHEPESVDGRRSEHAGYAGHLVLNDLHTPVLAEEAAHWLAVRPGGTYVDATVGLGGHALFFLRRMGGAGRLVGLDRDAQALEVARERLKEFEQQVTLVHASFSSIDEVLTRLGIGPADGVLADLGVSSMQLDSAARGFSFRASGPLDMRMNQSSPAERISRKSPRAKL